MAYLVDHGIDESRLTAVGFGSSRPLASNSTKAGKAQNRRVEFKFVDREPPAPAADETPGAPQTAVPTQAPAPPQTVAPAPSTEPPAEAPAPAPPPAPPAP